MIGIIDYGLSNIACVKAAVEYSGYQVKIIKHPSEIDMVEKVILPGVGAFPDAIKEINKKRLIHPLEENILKKKKPFLGICLGAQLICKSSNEFGFNRGFGWINAEVRKINFLNKNLRIPHTGWNNIEFDKKDIILEEIKKDSLFYFTHSYAIFEEKEKHTLAYCDHQEKFSAIVKYENIYATQFHPEKSQKYGLKLLSNFLKI